MASILVILLFVGVLPALLLVWRGPWYATAGSAIVFTCLAWSAVPNSQHYLGLVVFETVAVTAGGLVGLLSRWFAPPTAVGRIELLRHALALVVLATGVWSATAVYVPPIM